MTASPEEAPLARLRGTLAGNRSAVAIGLGVSLLAVLFVVSSLSRPEPPTFPPSDPAPSPAEGRLVGPRVYTVDARRSDRWQLFSFAQGSLVDEGEASGWDLGFRRFQVIVNGGDGFAGEAGVVGLGEIGFDSVSRLPSRGYVGTRVARGDSIAAPLEDWYSYSFMSHLLSPTGGSYAIRTADGRFAKLRFLGYYCPGAQPGCVTFEYVYQGAGGPAVAVLDAP